MTRSGKLVGNESDSVPIESKKSSKDEGEVEREYESTKDESEKEPSKENPKPIEKPKQIEVEPRLPYPREIC